MKKILTIIFIFLVSTLSLSASKDDILGRWITGKGENGNRIIVDFYEKNNKFYGKIFQLEDRYDSKGNLRKDINNPDTSKRERTLEGIDFVSGFVYNEEKSTYEKGKIYDPSSGKTYDCYIQLQEDGSLKVRGHLPGLTFIGKTQIWKRK